MNKIGDCTNCGERMDECLCRIDHPSTLDVAQQKLINMRKPYFAKWIAVEGEIKEGSIVKTMGEHMQPYKEGEMPSNKAAYQLYKLFLCSRDIQVGDKIRATYPSTEGFDVECLRSDEDKSHPHWVVKGQDEKEYFYEDFASFKVVGEISPNAGWVKEGDEFDEYEEWWWNPEVRRPVMKRLKEEWDKKIGIEGKLIVVCKVKGPFGHFH